MRPLEDHAQVLQHYDATDDLGARILAALEKTGFAQGTLSPADTASLDQFHVGGLAATEELANRLSGTIHSKTIVLDVGSGLGGPSRYLASRFGCSVVGVDLSESYCRAAEMLAERSGLEKKVSYRTSDALHLPFEDATFDLLWTQHVVMNIADRAKLYAEFARVLKRGGCLAMYDVVEGRNGQIHFPVPWAREPHLSHLLTPEDTRKVLERSGFRSVVWEEMSSEALEWLRMAAASPQTSPLGLHILLGKDFPEMIRNFRRNLEEHRCGILQAVMLHKN